MRRDDDLCRCGSGRKYKKLLRRRVQQSLVKKSIADSNAIKRDVTPVLSCLARKSRDSKLKVYGSLSRKFEAAPRAW